MTVDGCKYISQRCYGNAFIFALKFFIRQCHRKEE